jgi:2-dehydro-3-deoxy-D-arabinonate dehydratase
VRRAGATVFEGTTSTGQLVRTLADLVTPLCAANDFPDGVVLATGTGIVPEMDFTLMSGDLVDIDIERVGRLTNPVTVGKEPFAWLSAGPDARPELEEAR